VNVGAGLALALLSAFALNWGWLEQHGATQELPPLSVGRPLSSLRSLFGNRAWVAGFVVGLAGWVFYVAALALAPLSLVQATSAGGIGVLATLAHRRGHAAEWPAVAVAIVGLALLGVSLVGGAPTSSAGSPRGLAAWLAASALTAASLAARGSGATLGLAAGTLYAAVDVATKAAAHGGAWLVVVPVVLAAHGLAFVSLQLGFQRGTPLATAGTSTLLTNALPIAAGIVLFREHLPQGALGLVRVVAFACVVAAAALLARAGDRPARAAGPAGRAPGYGPRRTTRSATSATGAAARRNSAS
jgi:hypothetical protein